MDKLKKEIFANKVKVGVIIGVAFGIGGPIIINELYKFGSYNEGYLTLWSASDLLSYYGTILGAVATIIAVVATIKFSNDLAEKDRKHSEKINQVNIGIQACYDIMELCQVNRIMDIIGKLSVVSIPKDVDLSVYAITISQQVFGIANLININKKKLQFIYHFLTEEENKKIFEYVDRYQNSVRELAQSVRLENEKFVFGMEHLFSIMDLYESENDEFIRNLQYLMFKDAKKYNND